MGDHNYKEIYQPSPCSKARRAHEDNEPGRPPKVEASKEKAASAASTALPHAWKAKDLGLHEVNF